MKRYLFAPVFVDLTSSCSLSKSLCNLASTTDYVEIGRLGITKFFVIEPETANNEIAKIAGNECLKGRRCRLIMWNNSKDAEIKFPLCQKAADKQMAFYMNNPDNGNEKLIIGNAGNREEFPMGECSNLKR